MSSQSQFDRDVPRPAPTLPGLPFVPAMLRGTASRFLPGFGLPIALPESFGRLGSLEVRLAAGPQEIKRAQRLRYKVFYEEMSAVPVGLAALKRRDIDAYDAICDHLLVLDHAVKRKPFRAPKPKVVGTYRLLRGDVAEAHSGFYTAGEFDIAPLLDRHRGRNLLELGRSCVLRPYRNKKTVELLWAGIWAYVQRHSIDAMIGCASLEGTDPDRLAVPLSFLHHFARAEPEWSARPRPGRLVRMDRIAAEAIDRKAALLSLPPLVKAYLRVGAKFGEGAAIDRQFGTTDVFVALPVEAISGRYINYFGPTANRYAA
ncbi:GNAT family N-acetyltransferase [Enterovirga aerilata]|uniref:L-ornithine N(alpha)-acyltransferase n=1 Tax=Enterovirga aerilata TaxID=2730920 RepID=A0A849I4K1_9HYPH|nr:GNAT family N-acyltransferase [Enterovirga sp. DB1703]NNM71060.1 GNAT family N-acetyltransferase [Enterovirga sp. DB1703]